MKRLANKFALILILTCSFPLVCSNVDIKNIAEKISDDLEQIKNEELGIPFISKLYSSFKYVSTNSYITKNARTMAHKLETKIADAFSALENAKTILEDTKSSMNITNIPSTFIPCLQQQQGNDKDTEAYKMICNGLYTDNNTHTADHVETGYVLQRMRRNMGTIKNAVKQQYFISDVDVKSLPYSPFSGCTGRDDRILWNNYMLRNQYKRKNVVLVLDHGGSLSKRQFLIVKSIAKELISALNNIDKVALISIASDWFALANSSDCLLPNQVPLAVNILPNLKYAENSHKNTLYTFIDSLTRGTGATNHSLGMEKALEIIKNEREKLFNQTVMVLYISRGLLSSLTEAKSLLEIIAQFTNYNDVSTIINTCAVIDESKQVMYETHFLRDIAEQNYTKFNISFKENIHRKTGFMLALNSTDSIGFAVSRFYNVFNPTSSFNIEQNISLPTWDPISNDLSISFSIGWYTKENNFAMLGADIYFLNIAEDVTYYSSNQQHSYAFLIDLNGKVLMHPSFPRSSIVSNQLYFVDIKQFEKPAEDPIFRTRLLTEAQGFYIINENETGAIQYVWSRVGEWYVVCIMVNTMYSASRPFKAIWYPSSTNNKLLYQNLEGTDDYKVCKHLNQIATLDAASLYLSLSCFQSPFSASRTTQDKLVGQGYIAYLKDDTRLLANPGLKEEVRDEVAALTHVMDFLRKRHISSLTTKYAVRRYAASYTGVLQMFPGSILGAGLEPTKRPWFLRALQYKGKVVLIPPYLDGGGAGYIVTVAYATSQTVVAMDFTYGYMLKVLLEHMPFCMEEKVTCFLMDDQGYLIHHPNLMDVNGARPVEQQHIVHKESLVANDILNHKHFIRKLLCNNYGDSTIQRHYRINTSFTDVLVNFVPGEHCVSYRISMVPNTNVFVGIVNATCYVVPTFCPCSVVDRLCLNCNRMEQKECECPCECPLNIDTEVCRNPNRNTTDNKPCTWYSEAISATPSFTGETEIQLDSCFPNTCQSEQTFMDCLGLTGCEWCKYDVDGNSLNKPFCASITTCFNGVLGATTPYKGGIPEAIIPGDSDYSPIGPILGSVIAMCVLLILLFICYRSYTSPSTERLYLSSTQDNHLRMSDLNVNDNYHDLGNHRDKLLQEERPDPVSPYCVASTYRRTAPPADSDHGYSTMTPHDESEHLSLAPVEVDSLEDDLTSDNTSIHTSVSTKHHHDASVMSPAMFTRLPNRNCIVVPVTVHRNMETT